MKRKCDYCGGVNDHVMRSADGVPKTIEELKAFCRAKNLPLEKMRFYIGEDFRQPKAFGIYKDGDGNFVVYKNKGDGTRAERYRGKDEAYAVNEIYQKLKSEIQLRREKNSVPPQKSAPKAGPSGKRINSRRAGIAFAVGFILLMVILAIIPAGEDRPGNGYYRYDGDYYYYQDDTWFWYNYDGDYWTAAPVDSELNDSYYDYYEGSGYNSNYDTTDFSGTSYYVEPSENSDYNDDWDDGGDWDWGGDDWDIGDTDWDTDW